jgi:hypothetical protein
VQKDAPVNYIDQFADKLLILCLVSSMLLKYRESLTNQKCVPVKFKIEEHCFDVVNYLCIKGLILKRFGVRIFIIFRRFPEGNYHLNRACNYRYSPSDEQHTF